MRRSPSPPKVAKLRLQHLVGPLFLLLVVLCSLNVLILEGSQQKSPLARATSLQASDVSQRRLYWEQSQSPLSARPVLNDVKSLERKSTHTNSPGLSAGTSRDVPPQDSSIKNSQSESNVPQLQEVSSPEKHDVAATGTSSNAESGNHQAAREPVAVTVAISDPSVQESGMEEQQISAPPSVEQQDSPPNSVPQADLRVASDPETGSRNLVLGLAQGVDESNLAVFVSSLRNASSCTIVLFANTLSDEATHLFERYGVVSATFELGQLEPRQVRSYQAETYRWFLFQKYLEQNGNKYDKVLIADVDDTAFQSDPFIIARTQGVFVAGNNLKWIDKGRTVALLQVCYGKKVANQLGGEDVSDNGVVIGTTAALRSYVAQLTVSMVTPEFAACQKKGSDQVAHHVLQHSATIAGLQVLQQKDGLIAHLEGGKANLDKNSTVVNEHKERVPIVHQYDVDVKVAQKFFGSFVDKDFRFEKKGRGKCRAYMMQSNVLSYGSDSVLVHFAPEPALSLDRCCEMCTERSTSGCMGFIYDKLKATCRFKGMTTSTPGASGLVMPGATSGLLVR
eukprot:853896-Rhodomonas_salina.1